MTEEDLLKEVREVIEEPKAGYETESKILFDKKTKQYSVKIPKKIADRAKLDPEKQKFVFNFKLKNDEEGNIERILTAEVIPHGKEETSTE